MSFPLTTAREFKQFPSLILFLLISVAPQSARAIGIDLLGEVAKPLIGEAKDKTKGIMKYFWMQPYAGYSMGKGGLTQLGIDSIPSRTGIFDIEGFMYGARGGIELFGTLRFGADYSNQVARRKEVSISHDGTLTQKESGARNSMLGVSMEFNIPRTPIQVFGAKYFKATLEADTQLPGNGWGAGFSFMLFNPFILLAEYRALEYSSGLASDGQITTRNVKQYFVGLSFLLF